MNINKKQHLSLTKLLNLIHLTKYLDLTKYTKMIRTGMPE